MGDTPAEVRHYNLIHIYTGPPGRVVRFSRTLRDSALEDPADTSVPSKGPSKRVLSANFHILSYLDGNIDDYVRNTPNNRHW